MKESNYKTYEELPLFLNAETVANVLGIAGMLRKCLEMAVDEHILVRNPTTGTDSAIPNSPARSSGRCTLGSNARSTKPCGKV